MPKSKIKKKGCRSREKVGKPQAQTACQKAKSRKRDAGAGGKSASPKSTNGMPKSKIKKKGCRSREKAVKPQAHTACQKAKSRKKDAGAGGKSSTLKHKRHAKKQNQEKRMPKPGKSRQTSITNGMPKSKTKKKGCRNRGKADKPQA